MSSEEPNNTSSNQPEKPETYYQRKKNIIPGLDNEHLNFGLAAASFILGAIAVFPMARDFFTNFMSRGQQLQQQQLPPPPLPPVEETYIPPTAPQNMNGHSQQQQPVQEQTNEEEQKDNEDGLFHEQELRRRQKLLGQKARGSKYDSPFGKDIGGL